MQEMKVAINLYAPKINTDIMYSNTKCVSRFDVFPFVEIWILHFALYWPWTGTSSGISKSSKTTRTVYYKWWTSLNQHLHEKASDWRRYYLVNLSLQCDWLIDWCSHDDDNDDDDDDDWCFTVTFVVHKVG